MVTGQPVGIFDDALLTHIHQDWLATNGTDVVWQVFGRHTGCCVVLRRGSEKNQMQNRVSMNNWLPIHTNAQFNYLNKKSWPGNSSNEHQSAHANKIDFALGGWINCRWAQGAMQSWWKMFIFTHQATKLSVVSETLCNRHQAVQCIYICTEDKYLKVSCGIIWCDIRVIP